MTFGKAFWYLFLCSFAFSLASSLQDTNTNGPMIHTNPAAAATTALFIMGGIGLGWKLFVAWTKHELENLRKEAAKEKRRKLIELEGRLDSGGELLDCEWAFLAQLKKESDLREVAAERRRAKQRELQAKQRELASQRNQLKEFLKEAVDQLS